MDNSSSSVGVIVDQKTQTILLLHRAKDLSRHAGEICLPGGYYSAKHDIDNCQTAIRETFEETNIDLNRLAFNNAYIGNFVTHYQQTVHAYYFNIQAYPEIILSAESQSYFFITTAFISNKNNYSYHQAAKQHFLSLQYENHFIWGITATILFAFADLLPNLT